MNRLRQLLNELSEADQDRSYIQHVLVCVIEDAGLLDVAADKLENRFESALAEYRAEVAEQDGRADSGL